MTLNIKQRVVLGSVATVIILTQFLVFGEEGFDGFTWILSFFTAGILLVIALGSSAPRTKSLSAEQKQKAISDVHQRAVNAVTLAMHIGHQFDIYCVNRNLFPSSPILRDSTNNTVESLYIGYMILTICFMERKTTRSIFEYSAFKVLMGRAIRAATKDHVQKTSYTIAAAMHIPQDRVSDVANDISPTIDSTVDRIMSSREQKAHKCLSSLLNADEIPLLEVMKSAAPYYGGLASNEVLEARFGDIMRTLMTMARKEYSELGY